VAIRPRAQGNRLDMHMRADCRINLGRITLDASSQQETYQVPRDSSGGRVNIRNGPGVNYARVGAIPAGAILRGKPPLQCRPREDGIRGADWCHINWNGIVGWVSRAGMLPVQ
jgi:uncharacterized protein YraI